MADPASESERRAMERLPTWVPEDHAARLFDALGLPAGETGGNDADLAR